MATTMTHDDVLTSKQIRLLFRLRPSLETVGIWMRRGVTIGRGDDKKVVKLRSEREGSRRFSCLAWVNEFKSQLNN